MEKQDIPFNILLKHPEMMHEPEVFTDEKILDAITADIAKELGKKNLLGDVRKNLKILIPIIQKHLCNSCNFVG
jgi:hypothetical protein